MRESTMQVGPPSLRCATQVQGRNGTRNAGEPETDCHSHALVPELAYITAWHTAFAPAGKVAALLSELLPIGGTQHPSTVRNRTLRVGAEVVQANVAANSRARYPGAGCLALSLVIVLWKRALKKKQGGAGAL